METNYNDNPIEVLGLDEGIVKKLKQIFIYTVGQLQMKTEQALKESLIFQEETWEIKIILNALVKKTGRGFAEEIEQQDKIESIRKGIRNFGQLKKYGLCRISELMRMSDAELKTINGISYGTCENIKDALRVFYGEQYETAKKQIVGENPDAISLGHLNIQSNLFWNFREGEIYTVGDYQRSSNTELLAIAGVDIFEIERINKQLSVKGWDRYKKGQEVIEVWGLTQEMNKLYAQLGIERVDQLLDMTFEEMRSVHRDDDDAIIKIIEAYIKNITFRNRQTTQQGKILIILASIKAEVEKIKQDKEMEKKKLKEIIEMIMVSEK